MPDYLESHPSPTQADLVARLDLMETMIAEGRATTARYGWTFVMWGLLYCTALSWTRFLPYQAWAWPICMSFGVIVHIFVGRRQRLAGVNLANPRRHAITSVWWAVSAGISLFTISCAISHQTAGPVIVSAILFIVGLAHATSALILRWVPQGIAAAAWWAGGIAALFFTEPEQLFLIFLLATLFGLVLFGVYVMLREHRRSLPPTVPSHA